jgi:alpha-glucosidase
MLNTTNYTRTLWNRDAYRIPEGSNLYGAHPVYYDHRGDNGTHAVFLLNSNGTLYCYAPYNQIYAGFPDSY